MTNILQSEAQLKTQTTNAKITIHDLTLESDEEADLSATSTLQSKNTSQRTRKVDNDSGSIKQPSTSNHNTTHAYTESDAAKPKRAKRSKLSRSRKAKPDPGDIFAEADLNQTNDFVSGFTPYRGIIQKKPTRVTSTAPSRLFKTSSGNESCSEAKSKKALARKKTQSKEARTTDKEHDAEVITKCGNVLEIVNREKFSEHIPDTAENIGVPVGSGEVEACGIQGDQTCTVCKETVQEADKEDHTRRCLQSRFNFRQNTRSTASSVAKEQQNDHRSKDMDKHLLSEVSQGDIPTLSADTRAKDTNVQCATDTPATSVTSEDRVTCHVCHRDITELNSHRRLQHVNFCFDRSEKKRQEHELAVRNARSRILDCPLCGKPLQTKTSRLAHLKACSRALSVPAAMLRDRVKQQEEEHQLKVAAGILSPPTKVTRARNPRRTLPRATDQAAPVERLDADTQLALALSSSLHDQQPSATLGMPPGGLLENQAKTDAFRVLMTPKANKPIKRGRKNKGPERVPMLLLVDRDELRSHLAARMELLFSRDSKEVPSTPPVNHSRCLENPNLPALSERNYQICPEATLWTLTKLSMDCSGDGIGDDANGKRVFYVRQLMPHITMATQPQRHNLAQKPAGESLSGAETQTLPEESQVKAVSKSSASSNETLVATTQTAVYLAELAAESGNTTLNFTGLGMTVLDVSAQRPGDASVLQSSPIVSSPSSHEKTGFLLADTTADRHQCASPEKVQLSNDLGAMVDNSLLSDLQIRVKEGSVSGHKFMFAARCPHVLKDLGNANIMMLPEYDTSTVKDVMTFVYTGTIGKVTQQVTKLAAKWNLTSLVTQCNNRGLSTEQEVSTGISSQTRLDAILKNIWGSDYEESDSDDENNHPPDPNVEKDLEEAHQYALSPRKLSQHGEYRPSDTGTSDESGEDCCSEGAFDQMNMTATDVLTQLARMDQDSVVTSDGETLPFQAAESEDNDSICQQQSDSWECVGERDVDPQPTGPMKDSWECKKDAEKENLVNMHRCEGLKVLKSDPISAECNAKIARESNKRPPDSDSDLNFQSKRSKHNHNRPQIDQYNSQTIDSESTGLENIMPISTPSEYRRENIQLSPIESGNHEDYQSEAPTVNRITDQLLVQSDEACDLVLRYNPHATDGEGATDNQDIASSNHHNITMLEQEAPAVPVFKTPSKLCTLSSPERAHTLSDPEDFGDPATPELFDGSPQTPCILKDAGNRITMCPGSGRDLFEISSNSSDDGERETGASISPVFGSGRRQAERSQARDDLNAVFSTANDDDSDDDNSGGSNKTQFNQDRTQLNPTTSVRPKRKRSSSIPATPQTESVPNPNKKLCTEYVAVGPMSSPTHSPGHSPISNSDNHSRTKDVSDHQSYVLCSNDDLETSPIDLTQSEDDINDIAVNHTGGGDASGPSGCESHGAVSHHTMSPSPCISSQGDVAADVWSDFDDVGYTEDFLMPTTQATQSSLDNSQRTSREVQPSPRLSGTASDCTPGYDPPTDMETDVSIMEDDNALPSKHTYALKTPNPPRRTCHKRMGPPIPPSPFTPIADYETMVTPEIKKACQKYGVRAMPKKRMVKMLTSIYHDTHQYETDSELEHSFEAGRSCTTGVDDTACNPPSAQPTQSAREQHGSGSRSEDDPPPSQNSADPVDVSDDDLPEESFLGTQCSQVSPSSSPEKGTKDKASQKAVKIQKIRSYILSNSELYIKILHYEPLEFDEFREQLKGLGLRVGSDILMDFLDEQNIQFTLRKRKEERLEKREERRAKRRGGRGGQQGQGGRGAGRGSPRKHWRGSPHGHKHDNRTAAASQACED